jgi:S-formylglutathione hydrolase FrmB
LASLLDRNRARTRRDELAGLFHRGLAEFRALPSFRGTDGQYHRYAAAILGVFSMGTREDITDKLQALKKAGVKFYYVGCGEADNICVEGSKNLDTLLTKVGINHKFTFSPGGHTWANWRIYLNEWTPMLFR